MDTRAYLERLKKIWPKLALGMLIFCLIAWFIHPYCWENLTANWGWSKSTTFIGLASLGLKINGLIGLLILWLAKG